MTHQTQEVSARQGQGRGPPPTSVPATPGAKAKGRVGAAVPGSGAARQDAGLVTARRGGCVLSALLRALHIWPPSAWNQLFGDTCPEMPGEKENSHRQEWHLCWAGFW